MDHTDPSLDTTSDAQIFDLEGQVIVIDANHDAWENRTSSQGREPSVSPPKDLSDHDSGECIVGLTFDISFIYFFLQTPGQSMKITQHIGGLGP
jgi:hypothetical protein